MAIVGKGITKEFGTPPQRILHSLDFRINDGDFVSISGRSGSGKSTLLYILSTLDHPSSGLLEIDGENPYAWSEEKMHAFRNHKVGFVFQFHYLIPELTALENILLLARNLGLEGEQEPDAREFLKRFDIADKADKFPSQLSGGEQQRVAIVRALIMNPRYIFADEPTGNLDTKNGQIVMNTLMQVNREKGSSIILVTHEPDFAALAQREIYLIDGRISTRAHDQMSFQ